MGLFIYFFVVIMTAFGMATMILRKLSVWNTKTMKLVGKIHRVMAWVLIIVGIFAVGSGWMKWYSKYGPEEERHKKILGPILVVVMILIIVIMEVWFRQMRAEKDEFVKPTVSMTESEFEEKIKNGE
jgi:uncharacterized membrane protein YidH (DUF202 family)